MGTGVLARPGTYTLRATKASSTGKGIIGRKAPGPRELRHRQDEAVKYALSLGLLDAFSIGAESKAEQKDLIRRIAAA